MNSYFNTKSERERMHWQRSGGVTLASLLRATLVCCIGIVVAATVEAGEISFRRDIAPILVGKCLGCHDNKTMEGRYGVHTFESLFQPGENELPPVVPGMPEESYLLEKLNEPDEDLRMPQEDARLSDTQIELFGKWIAQGAKFDGDDPAAELITLLPVRAHPDPPKTYRVAPPVFALAFSPDGRHLITGGWHELLFWDRETGLLSQRLAGMPQRVHAIRFSPDGSRMVVAGGAPGDCGEIRLVDVAKPLGESKVLASWRDVVLDVAFASDSLLVAAGSDNSVRCYEIGSGKEKWRNTQHIDWVTAIDVTDYRFGETQSPNEDLPEFFALTDYEAQGGTHVEQIWRYQKGAIVRKANWELEEFGADIRLTRITESGIGKTYRVEREIVAPIDHPNVVDYLRGRGGIGNGLPGMPFVVTASRDRTAKVFRLADGQLFTTYKGHRREYGPLKGMHRLYGIQAERGSRRIWSAGEGHHMHGWDPVTVRDEDGTAADMEARFAKEYSTDLIKHELSGDVFAMQQSDSGLLAVTSASELAEFMTGRQKGVFDVNELAPMRLMKGTRDQLYCLAYDGSSTVAVAGYSGEVVIWDFQSGEVQVRFPAKP